MTNVRNVLLDRITLTGLAATGYHGVFDHEKRDGQEFIVDLVIDADLSVAAQSDDLADTIDYGQLAQLAHDRISGPAFDLIEKVAALIAEDIVALPKVAQVQVTVHKPAAPIPLTFADVAVSVTRRAQ